MLEKEEGTISYMKHNKEEITGKELEEVDAEEGCPDRRRFVEEIVWVLS